MKTPIEDTITYRLLDVRTHEQLVVSLEKIRDLALFEIEIDDYLADHLLITRGGIAFKALGDFTPYSKHQLLLRIMGVSEHIGAFHNEINIIPMDNDGIDVPDYGLLQLDHDIDVVINPCAYDIQEYIEMGVLEARMFDEEALHQFWRKERMPHIVKDIIDSIRKDEILHLEGNIHIGGISQYAQFILEQTADINNRARLQFIRFTDREMNIHLPESEFCIQL